MTACRQSPRPKTYHSAILLLFALTACSDGDGGTGVANTLIDSPEIVIAVIDPDTATVDTTVTVRITGSGFTEGSTATWLIDTTEAAGIRTLTTTWKSPSELEARIAISPDAALRNYSVRIRPKKGKQAIAAERFRVVAKPILLPEPGVRSEALGVNDSGVIVGWASADQAPQVAVRWAPLDTGWSHTVLGAGAAVAINNDGAIVRRHHDDLARHWRSWIHLPSGSVVDLGPAYVSGISDNGTLIGFVVDDAFQSTSVVWRQSAAGTWAAPQPIPIPQGSRADLTDINAAGDITGVTYDGITSAGVVWKSRDGEYQLPERIDAQLIGGAVAINDAGALAGWVWPCVSGTAGCASSPAYWPTAGGARRLLPTLYNLHGRALGMNNANQVVGSAVIHYNDGTGPIAALVQHAVIWFATGQLPEDLGAIRPGQYGEARAISNRGWVVGATYSSSLRPHATIWKLPQGLIAAALSPARQP